MRYLIAILSLILLVVVSATQAQPHGWPCDYGFRPGNTWFYRSTSIDGKTYSQTVVRDSIGADSSYWVYVISSLSHTGIGSWVRIHRTCVFEVASNPDSNQYQRIFIAQADSGDWWLVDTFSTPSPLLARVDNINRLQVFGKWITSKDVVYYPSDQSAETWYYSQEWAEVIGIIRKRSHPGIQDEIVGAIIDGVNYGNTSGVDDIEVERAKRVVLYPLPASNAAVLRIAAGKEHTAVVAIHDMLGRLVRRERMELLIEGVTTTPLDVSGLAPGAYIVAVEIDGIRYTTPLVIAR